MTNYFKFECGCRFPVLGPPPVEGALPKMKLDIAKVPLNCRAVWKMLGDGHTKGVFQLESNLGRQWTKKLKPEHIEHLAALGALLRPGCLRAFDDNGISMTEHYCLRKNNLEEVSMFHPCLDEVLGPTYGVLTYQEQAMAIARIVAGFTLQEADELRKAIGKKLPEEMEKVGVKFVAGVKKTKVISEEEGAQLFAWIKESQRYSFNKSHAVSYAMDGYWSAYCKAHMPVQFFCSYLYYSQEKQDPQKEVRELVNEARLMDVKVAAPDILNLEAHFSTDGKTVTFGLSDVKGIGEAQVIKLQKHAKDTEGFLGVAMRNWTWYDFLVHFATKCQVKTMTNLITVGAMRYLGKQRREMLEDLKVWDGLTDKERTWVIERSLSATGKKNLILGLSVAAGETEPHVGYNEELKAYEEKLQTLPTFTNLLDALKALMPTKAEGGGTANKNRKEKVKDLVDSLENPKSAVVDTPNWIAWNEENLLGIAISCTKIDACDTSQVNTSCKDFLAGKAGYMILGVIVQEVREVKVKKGKSSGQKMAFVNISDNTAALDLTCFADVWKEYGAILSQGNTVLIRAERDKRKDSLLLREAWQI
jgi:DNA polymerase III alpha subunit